MLSRTVRVFLSSTFRDFAEERDLLVRKVFPELRRKCRERQVELVDVDLRWGITIEEAQQGKVLPICLAEIDRARPYFMGFIGERYGWVPSPDSYDPSLLQEQPWLEEHRGGKSVTELEMLHGVLNNPQMAGRAFFYFRDTRYSRSKGGVYLSEGPDDKRKLEHLKEQIRRSRFPVVENYPTPEALAERVKEDLWKLIDEAYPEGEVPDALTRERMRHEAYGNTRLRLYLGGEPYFKALDEAVKAKPFRPVLITGQSGGGKSALVANWLARWSPGHPKTAVIVHHLGCGADAAVPVQLAVRLMREISRLTGDEFKPESDPDKQLEQLPQWLVLASAWAQRSKRALLIVLDGLDKVSDRQHLRWFPGFLPPAVKLVASCLDGEIREAARSRLAWRELKVKPFTKAGQKLFIGAYLGRYRKALTARQARTLQSHPLSGNPLFLLTVLEELRVFGVHEELEQRLQTLLSPPPGKERGEPPTVDDVFEHVLARIEDDLGKKGVQQAMEALWASRGGLYQDELLAIANLAPARWAAIQNALDESLYESGGKVSFGHDYLRKAVQDRYGLTGKKRLKLHRRLAEWFDARDVDERVADELPWQWQQAQEFENLRGFLLNLRNITSMATAGTQWTEFYNYWRCCGGEAAARSYLPILEKMLCSRSLEQDIEATDKLTDFVGKCRWQFTCIELDRLHLAIVERIHGNIHPRTLTAKAKLGNHLGGIWCEDAHLEAETLLKTVHETRKNTLGADNIETLDAAHDLGVMISSSRFASSDTRNEALAYLEEALCKRKKLLGECHRDTLCTKNSLAILYYQMNRKRDAFDILAEVCRNLEDAFGAVYPDVLTVQNNLAAMMRDNGDYQRSEILLKSVLSRMDRVFGVDHRDSLACLQDLGILYSMQGDENGNQRISAEIFKRRGIPVPEQLTTC